MLKKFGKKITKKSLLIAGGIAIALVAIVVAIAIVSSKGEKTKKNSFTPDSELARAMTYDQFSDEDSSVDGTDYVKFGAFFLRDINNDGYAEKIKGTCKQVGKEDTLYMELNVLTNGYLENGVITINSDNFYLQTAIPKDSEVKDNVISNNTKQISLNQINNGTQKLITGVVRSGDYSYDSQKFAAIGNDTTKYSKVNSVTLTGTHVAADGTRTQINKTIELNMDWYGTTKVEIPSYIANERNLNQSKDNTNVVDEENEQAVFEFDIGMQETNNQLILSKAHLEGTIPQLNGYDPSKVEIVDSNTIFTYDEETRVFQAEKLTELNEDGRVNKQCYDGPYYEKRYNKFKLKITYPLDAYNATGNDTVEIKIPVSGYYEGYNNMNSQFDNPYKSNIANGTIVVTYNNPQGSIAFFNVRIGKSKSILDNQYVISKEKPLKIYNQISDNEINDIYTVSWTAYTGQDGESTGIIMKEAEDNPGNISDKFVKSNASEESVEEYVSNTGVYFSNPVNLLGDNGWIKLYNNETNELLHEFTKEDWQKYNQSNPYKYDVPVKHIKIVTSATKAEQYLTVYNIKEIDDEYLTTHYSRNQFDDLKYVKTQLVGYLDNAMINKASNYALYEGPNSSAEVKLSQETLSTQKTEKNMTITINTNQDIDGNQENWKNGAFLIKLPESIIDIDLISVESDNPDIIITCYEKYEENGIQFIKILTSNESPSKFEIKIKCDITPDPRIATMTNFLELYASNEVAMDYYNLVNDIYDVNNNLNVLEKVNYSQTSITVIAPSTLLTNQFATEYDNENSIAVAPQVAAISKERKNAKVNIEINNNYSNIISDVKILGRVPFEGNKYTINGQNMESTFTTSMTDEGIQLPEKLEQIAKVYYSINGEATKDLANPENAWTQMPEDYSKVKSFLIDLGDYELYKEEKEEFSYVINIPDNISYNQVSYGHHAVYFSLETKEGKYRTQTEPNKIGFMIAKKYDIELTKFQIGKDKKISGATYVIYEDGKNEMKTRVTNINGQFILKNLYLGKTYVIKEIKSPDDYELNEEEIRFTTCEKDENFEVNILSGEVKEILSSSENDEYKIYIQTEDIPKARMKINKIDSLSKKKLSNVWFKLYGKGFSKDGKILKTDENGEIELSGLYTNEEYILEETKNNNYYLAEKIKFKVAQKDGTYQLNIINGNAIEPKISIENDIPIAKFSMENTQIATGNLEIEKVGEEDNNTLENAEFIVQYNDSNTHKKYKTDENGKINISNVYIYEKNNQITGNIIIKETKAPDGYSNNAEEIKVKIYKDENNEIKVSVENREELDTLKNIEIDGNNIKIVLKDKPLFKLTKIDSETGDRIANVEFSIYELNEKEQVIDYAKDCNGNYIGEFTNNRYIVKTNENGEIIIPIRNGAYKIVEISGPEKYETDGYQEYFKIGDTVSNTKTEDINYINVVNITNIEDLIDLSEKTKKYACTHDKYILTRNLDFEDDNSYENPNTIEYGDLNGDGKTTGLKDELTGKIGKGFTPIGSGTPFSGEFDGQGFEIKNLYENINEGGNSKTTTGGLFSYVEHAKIQNIGITGNIIIKDFTQAYVGSLVASATKSQIYNSYSKCNIKITSTNFDISYTNIGGLYGMANGNCKIERCYNAGDIEVNVKNDAGTDSYIGGIGGNNNSKSIFDMEYCYNLGNIKVNVTKYQTCHVGGISGISYTKIKNCYTTGDIDTNCYINTLVGKSNYSDEFINCHYNTQKKYIGTFQNNNQGSSRFDMEMKNEYFVTHILGTDNWEIDVDNKNQGYPILKNISNSKEYITDINYIEDLVRLAEDVNKGENYKGIEVKLKRSLDFNLDTSYRDPNDTSMGDVNEDGIIEGIKAELTNRSGKGFKPIGYNYRDVHDIYFSGIFNGNGYEIRNIYENRTHCGLLETVTNAVVTNIEVNGEYICDNDLTPGSYGGIIACANKDSIIENCVNGINIQISVKDTNDEDSIGVVCGGIAGIVEDSQINKCYNYGDINIVFTLKVKNIWNYWLACGAGIAGRLSYSQVNNSYNIGNITVESINNLTYAAGISGYLDSYSLMKNSYSIGDVKCTAEDNSIRVRASGTGCGTIENAYFYGSVETNGKVLNEESKVNLEYMKTLEFYNKLNIDKEWVYTKGEYPKLINILSNLKNSTELIIENTPKNFKITTEVEGTGGNISGKDENPYEYVKYGENSIKDIIVEPYVDYEIEDITINGEKFDFTADENGSYKLPIFNNVKENKHIIVKFMKKSKKIIIDKIDKDTKEELSGAIFKIDQIETRQEPDTREILQGLIDNGMSYQNENTLEEVNDIAINLIANGTYNFVKNEDGTYTPTNSKTYQILNGGTAGIANTTANSYIPIDLTGKTGSYIVVINAKCSSETYDRGYATITESTTAPSYYTTDGRFMYVSGETNDTEYESEKLNGGKKYYLHLGYGKDSSVDKNDDQIVIKDIKIYKYVTSNVTYNFIDNNGKYESTNKGKNNTTANSYIPINLVGYTGKYDVNINAQISSEEGADYGYVSITSNIQRPSYGTTNGRVLCISGEQNAKDYKYTLSGGKLYYMHLGYYKNESESRGEDKFSINSIKISLNTDDLYHNSLETDTNGKIVTEIPFGKYRIAEQNAPEGYILNSTPLEIDFTEEGIHQFTFENEKAGNLIVHHYIKGTITKIANDEESYGRVGEKYTTSPKMDIEGYELEKDSNGKYNIPQNAAGTYTEGITEVTYYYVEKEIPLTVHHYIEGTTDRVPLKAGGTASDVTGSGKEGESYTTSAIEDGKLSDEYELVETPSNANGTYTGNEVVVTYYYKKVARDVNLIKYKEDGKTPLAGAKFEINGVEYTTDENGKIKVKLEVGTYEVTEIEAPEGYKLPENPTTEITITKAIPETINITNEKETGTVTVHHYIEGTTEKVPVADGGTADDEIKTESIGDRYATKAREDLSEGYELVSEPINASGIITEEPIVVTYYYRLKKYPYTVNYIEKESGNILHNAKQGDEVVYGSTIEAHNEIIEINGYNYDSVDKETLTITTGENVINIYYTKRTDLSYTVNYLEKDTNNVLHEQKVQDGMTFESIVNSADEVIDIYGYNYDSVDKDTLTITTGENVINIYYTKKDTKVIVHYYEEGTTNKVSEDVEIPGKVFDDYTTESASDIPSKYELVAEPENKNGTMTEDEITVIYYYRKKATQVIVHYYEENTTKKLSEDVTINGRVDDKYTTVSADDIPIKYELVAIPSNASGSMTEATIEVIYYYRVKDAVVHVRYLEKGTNIVLADPDKLDGKVDDDYQTTPKVIDGYQLVEHTGNEKGKFEVEPLTITYYYLYKTKATVQYIDKITGQILEQSTAEGLEGDDFVTESKDFENYVLVEEPPEKTVKMTKEEQILKYYYIHVSGGVIEKHIDVISGQILANAVHNGNEGDEYDIQSRTFDGYDLVEDRLPSNAKGTMKVEPVEVIYYYIYRSKVTSEYIDKNTGNKLTEDVIQNGHEGDKYTTERKTFDDYKLVEVPANADGSMTKEDIKVTYYYVHTSGGVIVNHIDIKTGKQLLDETKEEGYEGDPYETHEENIPEYDLVKEKYPENAIGKMTIEPTRVTYYYIKKTEVNVKYVDKETGEEIDEPTNIPGHEGDDYTTEPKDVPGYDLVEEPENKDGTMTADPTEVIYYYKRPAKVIVNYYDIDTKEKLADEIEITGHQNDEYTTEQKDIKYYEIAKIPENKEGKMVVTVTKDENDKEIVDDTTYVDYYYRKLVFNLRVEKTIASVIVNGQETSINGSLGKVEVHRKNISTANVKVVYKIKVTNDSELTGKANIVENIPSGMTMIADNNPGWTINETTASIETDEVKPGESREYQVVLGWQNGDSNVGTKENVASIVTENEAGFEEKDKSDNESKADLIVAVGTGEIPYVAIAGSLLLIMISITAGIYVIKKKRQ